MLKEGTRIINLDESWINETNFTRKIWCPGQSPATVTKKSITERLSLIAALDTDGNVYYGLTQTNTD